MPLPSISLVIPTYCAGMSINYILRTIKESGYPIDILVIDSSSTDNRVKNVTHAEQSHHLIMT